ncbi:hypothetical protein HOLleu_23888 [Holothuria leucospilota]|uniref:Uncharacterized protein n=1 Tax=Holothuria leucospilota TaxID=206669 RepID=A0A9Q1BVX7_HOLLE|nr:hypothetical protein HOLleu_23888 [Holothuria leucospilota]
MVYRSISCQVTCDKPTRSNNCSVYESTEAELCVCADGYLKKNARCVNPSECGCFLEEANIVIPVSFCTAKFL